MLMAAGKVQVPRLVRGSVVVQKRRCGKANCHCASGVALHEGNAGLAELVATWGERRRRG
jgi:hypothetical protein